MHILYKDFNDTFANYLSISFYHIVYFLNLLVLAIFLVRYLSIFALNYSEFHSH